MLSKIKVTINEPFSDKGVAFITVEKEGYFLTEEELRGLIGNSFDAGEKHYQNIPMYVSGSVDMTFEEKPNKEQFIDSLIGK